MSTSNVADCAVIISEERLAQEPDLSAVVALENDFSIPHWPRPRLIDASGHPTAPTLGELAQIFHEASDGRRKSTTNGFPVAVPDSANARERLNHQR